MGKRHLFYIMPLYPAGYVGFSKFITVRAKFRNIDAMLHDDFPAGWNDAYQMMSTPVHDILSDLADFLNVIKGM